MLKHIDSKNFDSEVLNSDKVVVVDFFATWCMPCKMLTPVLENVANSRADIDICKVDIDEAEELAIKYQIQAVPTLIVFKDGKELNRMSGYMQEDELIARIQDSL